MTVVCRNPEVSVVIPALDEKRMIRSCIGAIGQSENVEIIVSDGGSVDQTVSRAARAGARVVSGARGRGPQLNLGAGEAKGEILLFVHADCRLPAKWLEGVCAALQDPETSLVCFRLHTEPLGDEGGGFWSASWLRLLDLRSIGLGLPYGDQGFAVRREIFECVGGFPEIPLMEDLVFARECRRIGRIRRLPLTVRTTARRFERHPIRARLMTASFPLLFRLGVSPSTLARWYGTVR